MLWGRGGFAPGPTCYEHFDHQHHFSVFRYPHYLSLDWRPSCRLLRWGQVMGVRELGEGKRFVFVFPKGSIMIFAGLKLGLHNLSIVQNLKKYVLLEFDPTCPSPETNMKPYTIQDLSDTKLQTSQPLKTLMVQSSCRLRLPVFCCENAEKGIEPPDRIAHNMVDRSLMIFKRWWLWIAWSLTIALVMHSPNKNQ